MIYLLRSLLLSIYYYIYYMGKTKKQLEEIMTFEQFGTAAEVMYNNKVNRQNLDTLVFDIEFFNN